MRPPTTGLGANPAGSRIPSGNPAYYYGGPRPPVAGAGLTPGTIRTPSAGIGANPGGIRNAGSSPYFYYGGPRQPGGGPGGAPVNNPYTWSRPRPPGGFPPGGQPGWGGGWNGGWNNGWGGGWNGGWGYSPYWNKAFYRSSWCPWYTGYPWGSIALGFAIGWLSSPGWGFGGYYAGSPYFGAAVAPATSYVVVSDPTPPAIAEPPAGPPSAETSAGPQARITVRLPSADAKLWIDEYVSTLTGSDRVLITPPLEPGKSYSYTLTVEWVENGQPKSRTRVIKFDPGDVLTVNFNHAD